MIEHTALTSVPDGEPSLASAAPLWRPGVLRRHWSRHPAGAALTLTFCALLLACFTAAPRAQPTGNPKGTLAPEAQGQGAKPAPAASPKLSAGPRLDDSLGPTEARTHRTEPPGGGTAGGLTRRNPQDAHPTDKARSDRGSAQPQPVPPSR
jgi:hypothetical protein